MYYIIINRFNTIITLLLTKRRENILKTILFTIVYCNKYNNILKYRYGYKIVFQYLMTYYIIIGTYNNNIGTYNNNINKIRFFFF